VLRAQKEQKDVNLSVIESYKLENGKCCKNYISTFSVEDFNTTVPLRCHVIDKEFTLPSDPVEVLL